MEAMDQIRTGMHVVGADGDEVGTVQDFKVGDPDAASAEGQTTGDDKGVAGDLVKGLVGDDPDVTEEQRERLLRLGYIKVDRDGLFEGHLYVASDDIVRVSGDSVHLSFTPE